MDGIRGQSSYAIVSCHCLSVSGAFALPFVSSTSVRGSLGYLTTYLCLVLPTRRVARHVTELRPVTVQLRIGRKGGGYLLVGSDCGSSLNSLSVTLSFLCHHSRDGKLEQALILSSVLRANRGAPALCQRITRLMGDHNVRHVVNMKGRVSSYTTHFGVRGAFCPSATTLVHTVRHKRLHLRGRVVLVGNTHGFNFSSLARMLRGGIRRAVLRIGLKTVVTGLGCCHNGLGPRAGVIYVIGTSTCNTNSCRVTGALRRRRISCLTITITSRNSRLHGTNVATGVVVVGPRVATFGAVFSCGLRPRMCDFRLLSTLVGRTRGRNVAGFPVRVGLSANVRHLKFTPRSVPQLVRQLGKRGTIVTHSIFSRLMKDSSRRFSDFAHQRVRVFRGTSVRLRRTFPRGVLHRVYGSTNVRHFPKTRFSVIHLNVNLCNIGPVSGSVVGGIDALGAAVLRVHSIPRRSAIKCDQGKRLAHPSHVTTLPVNCTSNLGHRLKGKRTCYLMGNRQTTCMKGVYVSIYVVSIASVSYGRNSDIRVFNSRLPVAILSSMLRAVPCRILADISAQMGHVCCRS